jgi:hypothetical protein
VDEDRLVVDQELIEGDSHGGVIAASAPSAELVTGT